MTKNCLYCKLEFNKKSTISKKEWESVKYCCKLCYTNSAKGIYSEALKKATAATILVSKKGRLGFKGSLNGMWNSEIKCCLNCNNNFFVPKYRLESAKYCSKKCSNDFRNNNISTQNEKDRKCAAYKVWRKNVYERDEYTCQICKNVGGILNADHIKPFALHKELRFDINNGRTLCYDCHKKTNTWGMRKIYKKIATVTQA